MTNPNSNMKRITLTIIAIILAFLLGVMFAPYLHADTGNTNQAAPVCFIMAKPTTHTWRYGTAASQAQGEIRRTIARGRPFGYRQVRGNCAPKVRIS